MGYLLSLSLSLSLLPLLLLLPPLLLFSSSTTAKPHLLSFLPGYFLISSSKMASTIARTDERQNAGWVFPSAGLLSLTSLPAAPFYPTETTRELSRRTLDLSWINYSFGFPWSVVILCPEFFSFFSLLSRCINSPDRLPRCSATSAFILSTSWLIGFRNL